MPIVTEAGFAADDWGRAAEDAAPAPGEIAAFAAVRAVGVEATPAGVGVVIEPTTEVAELEPFFSKLALIVAPFGGMGDGRGFSLARRLRDAGFDGRLRAAGELVPDQFAYARAVGFDEVEISEARAARQPEADWRREAARPGWYQRNLLNAGSAR